MNKIEFSLDVIESKEGGYIGLVREIAGVITQGESIEELKSNALDAARAMMNHLSINTI